MGFFSDKCQALTDPDSGDALSGEALEEAKKDKKWPRCGHKVSKKARGCSKCGSGAPGGWWPCHSCKKWVGNDSRYCPHCYAPLSPEQRSNMSGGIWRKEAGVLAERFDLGDVKRMLQHGLQIQQGTVALLLRGGAYAGILEAGVHTPETLASKINNFGTPPPRSAVIMDSGDLILAMRHENLMTAENWSVDCVGEIIIRFKNDKQAGQAFLENAFRDASSIKYGEIADSLEKEVRHALHAFCTKSSAEDLIRDPERRVRVKDEMEAQLGPALERIGYQLVRVSALEVTGPEYNQALKKQKDLDENRREIEYQQELRNLLNPEKMDVLKSELELKEYEQLLATEFGVRERVREREVQLLIQSHEEEDQDHGLTRDRSLELDALAHVHGVRRTERTFEREEQTIDVDHDIGIDQKRQDADLEQRQKELEFRTAQEEAERQRKREDEELARQREFENVDKALQWRGQKDKLKQDDAAHQANLRDQAAKRRAGMSEQELIAEVEDAAIRRDLLHQKELEQETERLRIEAEQQTLLQAGLNTEQQQKEIMKAKQEAHEQAQAAQRDAMDRMERMHKETLDSVTKVATEAAKRPNPGPGPAPSGPTIIK